MQFFLFLMACEQSPEVEGLWRSEAGDTYLIQPPECEVNGTPRVCALRPGDSSDAVVLTLPQAGRDFEYELRLAKDRQSFSFPDDQRFDRVTE
jgi:hypothetical protein